MRLQKYLAHCGVASRRAAEKLIEDGLVSVDGMVVRQKGLRVDPGRQEVCYKGKPVALDPIVHLLLNKPPKVICSSDDPQNRRTFLDLLPKGIPARIYSVGRLDYMSEGLLMVTNDGELAHRIMHPRYCLEKEYLVWTRCRLTRSDLEKMRQGIRVDGELLKVSSIELGQGRKNPRCRIVLREGRNRHIRRMFGALNIKIIRLRRVSIGPLDLGELQPGQSRMLDDSELLELRGVLDME